MIYLGIDVGTTHTKVLALDADSGERLALAATATPMTHRDAGDAHHAQDVLEAVVGLLVRVVAEVPSPARIAALCVASVGEEVVLLDADDRPTGETIAWYDQRGFAEAAAYLAGPGGEASLSRRWPPDRSLSLFKLLWTQRHRPAEMAAAASWTDLGDYVLLGLGGERVMDWTHASRAGAFDLRTRDWDVESLEAAALPLAFPRLVPSGTVVGTLRPEIAERVGVPHGVRLVTGGHDHLCAAFGAGVDSASDLFLSAGTSEAHLALLAIPILDRGGRYHLDQGCFVDGDAYYAHVNIHSGHFFRQWRDLLYADVDDEGMYAEIVAAGRRSDVTFELLDDLRVGRLSSVPYDADRAALMYAILEGLAERSADIVAYLEEASGHRLERIVAVGHPPQVPLWRSLREQHYGRPVTVVDEPEMAAYGAARLAMRAR
jgi:xylulokinase